MSTALPTAKSPQPQTPGAVVERLDPAAQASVLSSAVAFMGNVSPQSGRDVAERIGSLAEEMTPEQQVATLLAMASVLGSAEDAIEGAASTGAAPLCSEREAEAVHAALVQQIADQLAETPLLAVIGIAAGLADLAELSRGALSTTTLCVPVAPAIAALLADCAESDGYRASRQVEAAVMQFVEADRDVRFRWRTAVEERYYGGKPPTTEAATVANAAAASVLAGLPGKPGQPTVAVVIDGRPSGPVEAIGPAESPST